MKFSDSLNRRMDDIKQPMPLPIGHYIWAIEKMPDVDTFTSKDGDEFERVTFQIACAGVATDFEDVDEDELAEYGDPAGARNRKTFLFNTNPEKENDFDRSLAGLKRFLGHAGMPVDDDSKSLEELIAESIGMQFYGQVTHRLDPKDDEIVYAEVGRTAIID